MKYPLSVYNREVQQFCLLSRVEWQGPPAMRHSSRNAYHLESPLITFAVIMAINFKLLNPFRPFAAATVLAIKVK